MRHVAVILSYTTPVLKQPIEIRLAAVIYHFVSCFLCLYTHAQRTYEYIEESYQRKDDTKYGLHAFI